MVTSHEPIPGSGDMCFGYDVEQKANAFSDLLEHRPLAKVVEMHGQSLADQRYIGAVLNYEQGLAFSDRRGYVKLWWKGGFCPNSKSYCGRWDAYDTSKRRWKKGDTLHLSRAIPWSRLQGAHGAWIMEGAEHVGWAGEGENTAKLTIQSIPQCNWNIRFQMKMRDAAQGTAAGFGFKDDAGQTQYFLLDAAWQNPGMIGLVLDA